MRSRKRRFSRRHRLKWRKEDVSRGRGQFSVARGRVKGRRVESEISRAEDQPILHVKPGKVLSRGAQLTAIVLSDSAKVHIVLGGTIIVLCSGVTCLSLSSFLFVSISFSRLRRERFSRPLSSSFAFSSQFFSFFLFSSLRILSIFSPSRSLYTASYVCFYVALTNSDLRET